MYVFGGLSWPCSVPQKRSVPRRVPDRRNNFKRTEDLAYKPGITCVSLPIRPNRAARGFLKLGRQYGAAASALVAEHLSPWIIQPDRQHPWVNEKLGIAEPLSVSTD